MDVEKAFVWMSVLRGHGDVHVANEQFKGIENIDFFGRNKTLYYLYFVLQYLYEIACRNADPYW